jgi:hypothetical protein
VHWLIDLICFALFGAFLTSSGVWLRFRMSSTSTSTSTFTVDDEWGAHGMANNEPGGHDSDYDDDECPVSSTRKRGKCKKVAREKKRKTKKEE